MESMAIRQRNQQEQAMRNTWANQQQANNIYNNAARYNPNSNEYRQAMQAGNSLQRKANETARQFNELFRK